MLDIIRGCIRPAISILFIVTIVGLAWIFALKFGDADMARQIITFVLATGATVIGFWFGERKVNK